MRTSRPVFIAGYVKIEIRSRTPRRWGWELYRNGNEVPLSRSDELFRCAEEAWQAGQVALLQLAPAPTVERFEEIPGSEAQDSGFGEARPARVLEMAD
jgi:hypothetical protein